MSLKKKGWVLPNNVLWRIYVAGNDKTHLDLHVKCPTFLADFNQIWSFLVDFHNQIWILLVDFHNQIWSFFVDFHNQIWSFSVDFHTSSQYQIARKSESRRRAETSGQTDIDRQKDGRTDMTRVIGDPRDYEKGPKQLTGLNISTEISKLIFSLTK
jgi:hypothetical protein